MRWWGLLFIIFLVNPVFAESSDYSLKIKAFLQGAYVDDDSALMHDTLRQKNLIPEHQPFSTRKFAYQGTENIDPSLLVITGEKAITDWVLVELRDPDEPTMIAARKAVLLQRDGNTIESTAQNGDALNFTGLAKDSYYVAIHHRNHSGTMTAAPITLSDGITSIDFSHPETATNHEHDRVILTDQLMGLRAGYINSDPRIIASGPGNDLSDILTIALTAEDNTDFNTNFITTGYLGSDLNLDGQTVFAGPDNDAQILLGNVLAHPLNTDFASNYIIDSIRKNGTGLNNLPINFFNLTGYYTLTFKEDDELPSLPISGSWVSIVAAENIYIKVSDEHGYFLPTISSTNGEGHFELQIPLAENNFPPGRYKTNLRIEACADATCSSTYASSLTHSLVRLDIQTAEGNSAPVAHVGLPQQNWLAPGDSVQFYGHFSYDAESSYMDLNHHWTLVSKPENSQIEFTSHNANPIFQADQPGDYVFEYYVDDGELNSQVLTITIVAANGLPTADFTYPKILKVGRTLELNATTSSDPENDPLSYTWKLLNKPAGSASQIENSQSVIAQFTPDIPGDYQVALTVSDGYSSIQKQILLEVRPENTQPVAQIENPVLHTLVNKSTLLDASVSSDYDEDPLSFQWSLLSKPENSQITLDSLTDKTITLTPDVLGEYQLQLIVNDGKVDSIPLDISLTAHTEMARLDHAVIDAEFSSSLNRIISIATNPNKLHIIDPVTQQDTSVDLPLLPKNVSVGPDGKFAAVGHDAWVSHINLETAELLNTYPITIDSADIVLDGNGFAHIIPSTGDRWAYIHSLNLVNGDVKIASELYVYEKTQIKLHPSGEYLYGADSNTSPSDLEKFNLSTGTAEKIYESTYHGEHDVCGDLWLSEDGLRIFSKCKNVFRSHAGHNREQDMLFNGQLTALDAVEHLSHSSAANLIFAIAIKDENATGDWYWSSDKESPTHTLNIYGYDFLDLKRTINFDDFVINSNVYDAHGRYVFANEAGTEYYVIVQADKTSGLQDSYGLQVYPIDYQPPVVNSATDAKPIAKALSTQNIYLGQTATLNGSNSPGDIQSYRWKLLKSPQNSSALINNATSAEASFTPDLTGQYNFSLTVNNDEENSPPQIVTLTVHEPVGTLNHQIVDAEYSLSLDRIISIGMWPDRLYITDPETQQSINIDLPAAPNTVSVSPDGHYAIVGHDLKVTHVDLKNASIINSIDTEAYAHDIVIAANNYAYVLGSTTNDYNSSWRKLSSINLETEMITEDSHAIYDDDSHIKLHPSGNYIYGIYNDRLEKFDITDRVAEFLYRSNQNGNPYPTCENFWLSADGSRIFGRCGYVYRTSPDKAEDMSYGGSLPGMNAIDHLTHSAITNQIFLIPGDENSQQYPNPESTELKIYDNDFLVPNRAINLRNFVAVQKAHEAQGRFVFVNSAGTKIYVIAQANETSGMLNDYGLQVYPIDYQEPVVVPEAFSSNLQKWLNYSESDDYIYYKTQQSCECEEALTQSMNITERSKIIYDADYSSDNHYMNHATRQSLLTITKRFKQLRDAYYTEAHNIEVTYDLQYGYPTSVMIDYNTFIADDELSYTISDLEITADRR